MPRHSPYTLSSLTIRNSNWRLQGLAAGQLGTGERSFKPSWPSPPTALPTHASAICTLRVCGRKNYRLQDIQLSKITLGTASPNPSRARSRGPHDPHSARAGRSLAFAPDSPARSLAGPLDPTPLPRARSRSSHSTPMRRRPSIVRCPLYCSGRAGGFSGPSEPATRQSRRFNWVENTGLEPVTSWLQTRRSPS